MMLEVISAKLDTENRIVAQQAAPTSATPTGYVTLPPNVAPSQMPAYHEVILPAGQAAWLCPVHGSSKLVPAGVSKRTRAAYDAFIVCDQQGCDQRPPRTAAPARAFAPSQPKQLP